MTRLKLMFAAVAVASCGLIAGCNFKSANLPDANADFADTDYELGDKVSEKECNTYILGIDFSRLFGSDTARVPGQGSFLPIPLGTTPETAEAMYKAVQKMPDATHLIEPRTHVTAKGLGAMGTTPVFGKRCSKVNAYSVKVKGPYKYPNK